MPLICVPNVAGKGVYIRVIRPDGITGMCLPPLPLARYDRTMNADEADDVAADTFAFAMQLIDSLGVRCDRQELLRRLAAVAAGESSVVHSPDEEITAIEAERGGMATEAERLSVKRAFRDRRGLDEAHREIASRIMRVFERGGKPPGRSEG